MFWGLKNNENGSVFLTYEPGKTDEETLLIRSDQPNFNIGDESGDGMCSNVVK